MSSDRPLRPCKIPGCPGLAARGYCDVHRDQDPARRGRASPTARGYGRRWQRATKRHRAAEPDCRACGRPGTQTDHIVPVTGPDDPLFWDESNWQTLCDSCHSRKTVQDGRFGPPKPRADPAPIPELNPRSRTIAGALGQEEAP